MKQKYQTTKKQCQDEINKIGNVCDRCGRELQPLKTVDNAINPTYWVGCMHGDNSKGAWGHFTHGVKKEIYKLAYKIALEDDIYFYSEKDTNYFDYWFKCSMSKICGMLITVEKLKHNKPRYTKSELRKNFNKYNSN